MTTTPQAPTQALPTPPASPEPTSGEPKRQRFTLTRARDLDARLDAIVLRANAAVAELAAVGIAEGVEEANPVRQQLAQILPSLTAIVEAAGTGHDLGAHGEYIGTVHLPFSGLVFHLFDEEMCF